MSGEPENLVLRGLRRIAEQNDRILDEVREIKARLGILEQQYAVMSTRFDRLDLRVERIERRLDLVEEGA